MSDKFPMDYGIDIGVSAGRVTLEIDIGGCSAARPTFTVKVVENVSVGLSVCILADNGKLMRDIFGIQSMLPEINDVFEQVGMSFSIDSIIVTNITEACRPMFDIRYEDNPYASWGEIRYAIQCAGGNSNRVVTIMKQLIDEEQENEGAKMFYLSEIGKYGTIADLPFLYQSVGVTNLCEHATVAVLSIEGLTTNSLTQIISRLPKGIEGNREAMCSWVCLLHAARELPVGSSLRTLTVSNAVLFASRETGRPSSFDKSICLTDPTYQMSKRRLAVLRSVRDLGPNEWQTNFVTRTIHELESYPEANLPE